MTLTIGPYTVIPNHLKIYYFHYPSGMLRLNPLKYAYTSIACRL